MPRELKEGDRKEETKKFPEPLFSDLSLEPMIICPFFGIMAMAMACGHSVYFLGFVATCKPQQLGI